MSIRIEPDKCTGCKLCLKSCPFGLIVVRNKKAVIDITGCNLCGQCLEKCKFKAIIIEREKEEIDSDWQGVWVFAEERQGQVAGVSFELLGLGRKLADELEVKLTAILLGDNISAEAKELISYGADEVYVVDDPGLKDFQDDSYSRVLTHLIREKRPEIVLAGATSFGRSFIPRVAASLGTGLTADCTELSIDKEKRLLLQTRPAFGGNIMATIICPARRPQMATVRPKVMKRLEKKERPGRIVSIDLKKELFRTRTKVIDFIEEIEETINLAEADIIVAGGRGFREAKRFALLKDLARVIGGAVGASRGAVDAGWISYSHQIGQTGRTVSPRLYIACGISGSVQHLAGMSSSEIIVAINNDPHAPIFNVATYGLVGDLFEIVPKLIAALK